MSREKQKIVFSIKVVDGRKVRLSTMPGLFNGSTDNTVEPLGVSLPLRSVMETIAAFEGKHVQLDLLEEKDMMRTQSEFESTLLQVFTTIKVDETLPLHEKPFITKVTQNGFTARRQ